MAKRDVDIRIGGDIKDLEKVLGSAFKNISGFVKKSQGIFKQIDIFKDANENVQRFKKSIDELQSEQAKLNTELAKSKSINDANNKTYKETTREVKTVEQNVKDLNKAIAQSRKIARTPALRKEYEAQGTSVKTLKSNIDKLIITREKSKATLLDLKNANKLNRQELANSRAAVKAAESANKSHASQLKNVQASLERFRSTSKRASEALRAEGIETKNLAREKQRLAASVESAAKRSVRSQRLQSARDIIGLDSNSLDRQIRQARAAFERLRRSGSLSAKEIELAFKKTQNRIREIRNTARRTSPVFRNLAASVAGVFAGARLAQGAVDFVNLVDEYKSITAQIKVATRSEEEFNIAQVKVFEIAKATRTPLNDTAKLYGRIARATKKLNVTQKQQFDTTTIVNQSILASGANAREAEAAVIQLGQALASGRLSGDELRSVAEQTPRLARAIADGLGVPIGALKELGKQGKLTSEVVIGALLTQKDIIDREFAQLPVTVGQALSNLKTSFTKFAGEFEKETGFTEGLASAIQVIADNLPGILSTLGAIAKVAVSIFAGRLIGGFITKMATLATTAKVAAVSFRAVGVAISGMLGGIPGLIAAVVSLGVAFIDLGDDAEETAKQLEKAEKAASDAVKAYKALTTEQARGTARSRLSDRQQDIAKKLKEQLDLVNKLQAAEDKRNASPLAGNRLLGGSEIAAAKQRKLLEDARKELKVLQAQSDATAKALNDIFEIDLDASGINKLLAEAAKQTIPDTFDKKALQKLESLQNSIKTFAAGIAKKTATTIDEVLAAVDKRFLKTADDTKKLIDRLEKNVASIQATGGKDEELEKAEAALAAAKAEEQKLKIIVAQTKEKEKQLFIDKEIKTIVDGATKLQALNNQVNTLAASVAGKTARTVQQVVDAVDEKFNNLRDKAAKTVEELTKIANKAATSDAFTEEDRDTATENQIAAEAAQAEIELLVQKAQAIELVKNLEQETNRLLAERKLLIEEQNELLQTGSIPASEAQANIRNITAETNAEMELLRDNTTAMLEKLVGADQAVAMLSKIKGKVKELSQEQQLAIKINDTFANGLTNALTDFIFTADSAKDAFKKFAVDFLKRIAQMILQQTILNALGGGGGVGGAFASVGSNHAGGLAGQGQRRLVNPAVFFNAPKYHEGGIAGLKSNEVPSILKRDEEILTRDDPRHAANGGNQGISLQILNAIDPVSIIEAGMNTPAGTKSVMNILRANKKSVRTLVS